MGNVMWHVALKPDSKEMQDVIVAKLGIDDFEQICGLLGTARLKGKEIETNEGGYIIMYGGEFERPYPSVMIWRYQVRDEENIVTDMEMSDSWILKQIWRDWLISENDTCEFIPPETFLYMAK